MSTSKPQKPRAGTPSASQALREATVRRGGGDLLATFGAIFASRRMTVLFLLGFSSGLPLLLVGSTATYRMTDSAIGPQQIGAFAAVGLPYTFKFLWAPLLDRYVVPGFGRRRGWLYVFQVSLIAALLAFSTVDPQRQPAAFFAMAFVCSALAASQDIVVDAYTTDILRTPEERILGSSVSVTGFRVAMLIAGSLALVLADHLAWQTVYIAMACMLVVGLVGTTLAVEPAHAAGTPRTLQSAVIEPFTELFGRLGWRTGALVLAFAATYKFGEQFAGTVTSAFYKIEIGFTNTDIGLLNKLVGFLTIICGGIVGTLLVTRFGMRRMLVLFGVLQALTHVAYILVSLAGDNLAVFAVAIAIENLSAAMATSAFVAALIGLCNPRVSATQYALLTSLTSVGARVFGRFAGDLVVTIGYRWFFVATIAMAIPGIVLAWVVSAPERAGGREVARLAADP